MTKQDTARGMVRTGKQLRRYLFTVLSVIFLIPGVWLPGFASAESLSWEERFRFNGFFSLDASVTDSDLELVSNSGNVALYEKEKPSLRNSILGAQTEFSFTSDLSLLAQGKFYTNEQDAVRANLDWAYLTYDAGHDYTVRVGRFLIPFMQGIETRSVGMSRLWARPLIPFTGAGGYSHYLGAEVVKNVIGDTSSWRLQLGGGQSEHSNAQVEGQFMAMASALYERDVFWARLAFGHTEYDVQTPTGTAVKSDAKAQMASFEAEYTGDWLVTELGYSTTRTEIIPDDTLAYLSIGVPMGSLTPFVLTTWREQKFEAFNVPQNGNPRPEGQLPPPVGKIDFYSYAVGGRWSLHERYTLKCQLERLEPKQKIDRLPRELGTPTDGASFSITFEGVF